MSKIPSPFSRQGAVAPYCSGACPLERDRITVQSPGKGLDSNRTRRILSFGKEGGHDHAPEGCCKSLIRIRCRNFGNVLPPYVGPSNQSAQGIRGRGAVRRVGAVPCQALPRPKPHSFADGQERFAEIEVVTGGNNNGLGPRFNSNQCLSCHSQPAGGRSGSCAEPLIAIATLSGARNLVPWFITPKWSRPGSSALSGIRTGLTMARVHNIFTITGRSDAAGCNIDQPEFVPAGSQSPARRESEHRFPHSRNAPSSAPGSSKQFRTQPFSRT